MKKPLIFLLAIMLIITLASCKNEVPKDLTLKELFEVEGIQQLATVNVYMFEDLPEGEHSLESLPLSSSDIELLLNYGVYMYSSAFPNCLPEGFGGVEEGTDIQGTGILNIIKIDEDHISFTIDATYAGKLAYDSMLTSQTEIDDNFKLSYKLSFDMTADLDQDGDPILVSYKVKGIKINGKKYSSFTKVDDFENWITTIEYNGHTYSGQDLK